MPDVQQAAQRDADFLMSQIERQMWGIVAVVIGTVVYLIGEGLIERERK